MSILKSCVNCSCSISFYSTQTAGETTVMCYRCFRKHQDKIQNTKLNFDKRTDRSFVTYKTLIREKKMVQAEPVWEKKRKETKKRNNIRRKEKFSAIHEFDPVEDL